MPTSTLWRAMATERRPMRTASATRPTRSTTITASAVAGLNLEARVYQGTTLVRTLPMTAGTGSYTAVWDGGTRTVLTNGGSLSHHHGIGLNRARCVREALGGGFGVLTAMKAALDPNGICNPGKLGLPDAFGAVRWPPA